jgi:undecaprenyl-diphosphatase
MRAVTDLGSSVFLIPLIIAVAAWFWCRRASARQTVLLGAAYAGAEVLSQAIKALTARPRPPASLAIAHFGGHSFPSGHTTNATAVYGMLAVVVASTTPRWRRRVSVFAGAVAIAVVVGVTRLYLGAHWLTDVLAGWALGAVWLLAVVAVSQAAAARLVSPREE